VSQYQKGKINLDFIEATDSEWQWLQLGHMQVCISLQTDNHASAPPVSFFTGRMPFLLPYQQRQSTESNTPTLIKIRKFTSLFSSSHQSKKTNLNIVYHISRGNQQCTVAEKRLRVCI